MPASQGQVEGITQGTKGVFRLGKQRFCSHHHSAVFGMLENAVLMRMAVEHRGTRNVGPVGGQHTIGMPRENHVSVVGAIDDCGNNPSR